ncbi:Lipoprotein lplA [uncultured Ruminococcus sp.]|uniref:Extracellular solute-binding protein n=1 Tax=Massiliimalia timonensis TaxID=1987501 RepID=A0A8J6P8E6_9FIRM|nr:extracellular solute-binding protein [Massiliimalia timonensis]MBC8611565.1 extracellular solute-binding protein [Massiliimalia timonensis]MBS7176101.1 extracellular solute-binding protein [Clostridiales bacterium]SCH00482.1 Lipoprotein lplA [uncultured Clostridium sp.]SCH96352.1 Lipoprotein lplA [uncultured Ruminococcus sp.]
MKGKRFLAILLAGMLSAGALTACGKENKDTSGDSAKSNEVTFVFTKGGFENHPDNDVIYQKICEAADVTLNHISPPAANYDEKLTLILSGQEGDLPDLVKIQKTQFNKLFDYADQGALMDLTDLVKDCPNILENIPQEALDMCTRDGKLWAIPIWCSPNRMNTIIRQDWLDNLGLEAPETLEEYHDVLKAFTFDDPDQNGKNDTYGMTGCGMEALEPYLGAFGVTGIHQDFFYEDNGKLIAQAVNPKAKEALAVLRDWYAEGLIDPEFAIMKNDSELNDKAMKNQFGVTYRWWTWEPKIEQEMQKVDPDVTFARIAPPVGPDGTSGVRGVSVLNGCVVMLKDAKNPEACMRLLDWYHTEEGMMTVYTGVEGTHWEKRDDGKYYTLPQFDEDQSWIQWYSAFESEWPLLQVETPLVQSRRDAFNWPVITNAGDGYITDAQLQYSTDLTTLVTDAYTKIITGQEPLDYFDQFVQEWYAKGGQEWTDQINEMYQADK